MKAADDAERMAIDLGAKMAARLHAHMTGSMTGEPVNVNPAHHGALGRLVVQAAADAGLQIVTPNGFALIVWQRNEPTAPSAQGESK